MLSKAERLEFLNLMAKNTEKKIYNFELEMRVLERKKITGKEGNLIMLENLITSLKNNQKSEEEKLELVEEEIVKYSK